MNTLNKLVVWLIVIMIISFSISGYFFNQFGIGAGDESLFNWLSAIEQKEQRIVATNNIDFSKIENVFIITKSEDIEISQHTDAPKENIILLGSVPDNMLNLSIEQVNTNLTISVIPADGFVIYDKVTLKIELPDKFFNTISVNTKSGDSNIDITNVGLFKFESISGDIISKTLYAGDQILNTKSGDITLSNQKGNLSIKTVSGDTSTYYESLNNDINIESTSGDISLSFEDDVDFSLTFDSANGDYSIGFPVTFNNTNHEVNAISGEGLNNINIKTISGDLKIY